MSQTPEKFLINITFHVTLQEEFSRHWPELSTQGVKSNYKLKKSLADIVMGDVIEATDGPIHITR